MKNLVITLMALFFLVSSQRIIASQNRIALVIGNSDYKNEGALKNPVNDANSMEKVLSKMGFKVIKGINLSRKQMRKNIRDFGDKIKKADAALFYYSGHGFQYDGDNYLVPVKSNIQSEDEIQDESINASSVLRKMESARADVNIVILDACRSNPFKRSFRSSSRGLTRMEGPKGTLIAYATAPGSVASDGSGNNGLYTESLIKYMQEPIPLEKVFKKVRTAVSTLSNDKQIPWESSSLTGKDFYFNLNKTTPISTSIIQSTTIGNQLNNDAESQFKLGEKYQFGQGVLQDYKEAVRWYRMAAEQGHSEAAFNLGWMYNSYPDGEVFIDDRKEVVKWWRLAAQQGHSGAQEMLRIFNETW